MSASLRLLCIPHCHVFLRSGKGKLLFCLVLYPHESVFRISGEMRLGTGAGFIYFYKNKENSFFSNCIL